jgi:phage-related tail protein
MMSKSLDLQVILAARDKVTGPLKKINASSTGTAKALKKSQQEIKRLKGAQRDVSSFRKMDRAIKDNGTALSASQEKVRQLGQELKSTSKPTAKLRSEYNKARKEVEQFTREGQEQRKELGAVRKRLKDAGISTRNLANEERRLAERMKTANDRIQRQKRHLEQLGKADVSGKFRNMTGEVGKFGRRTAMLGGAAAGGIFAVANSTATLGDSVAKTADKIGVALGPYQELRYAAERSGISTQKLDSNMVAFTKRLGEAKQGTGAARKAYDQLGLSSARLAEMTPEDALNVVADRLAQVDSQTERVALAAQMFSREGVGMVNMLKDGSGGLKELRRQAQETGYVLSDKAARDAEVFKDSLLDAQLGLAGMKNTIGAELMPAISDMMGDLSGWMKENRDHVKAFAKEFGTNLKNAVPVLKDIAKGAASTAKTIAAITSNLAGMVGGFDNLGMILAVILAMKPIMAILAFGKSIVVAGTAVYGLVASLGAVGAAIKVLKVALIASGIGLLIAGIGTAAYLIYKHWDGIAAFFKGIWAEVKGAFGDGLGGIAKLLVNWSPIGLLYKGFSALMSWLGVDMPANLTGAGGKMIAGLVSGIRNAASAVAGVLSGLWGNIKGAFSDGIAGVGKLILNWSPLGLFYKAFKGVLGWFGVDLPESFTGFGKQILDGLVGGIMGGLNKVKETITGAGQKAIGWFKGVLGIKSPSRVFMGAGRNTLEGYRQGLQKQEPKALKQMDSFGKRVRQAGAGIAIGASALPAAAGDVQFDNRPPVTGAAATQQQPAGDSITINVNAAQGQSAQEIAAEVQRILAERDRAKATRARSALYDRD